MHNKKLYVLDTNVLLHDPYAVLKFEENDLYIPSIVIDELDEKKKASGELGVNAREVNRLFDRLLSNHNGSIETGIDLSQISKLKNGGYASGKIFFQTKPIKMHESIPYEKGENDNRIIAATISLLKNNAENKEYSSIIIVSKDTGLRIKTHVLKIESEDYENDKVIEDADLLPPGFIIESNSFWGKYSKDLESWSSKDATYYKVKGDIPETWYPNTGIIIKDGQDTTFRGIVTEVDANSAKIKTIQSYQDKKNIWDINARDEVQNLAMNLLLDPETDFVTLLGQAGTGKTLLTITLALHMVIDLKLYDEIIMTRVTVPMAEDIGFLPGTEEEKMDPWMGALHDNLDFLLGAHKNRDNSGTQDKAFEDKTNREMLMNYIKLKSMNYMRGRTFHKKLFILDEAQNLTARQMKALITRCGEGSKMICLGNVAQIDHPYLSETTSGLTNAVDHFKSWPHSGHVTLISGQRSRLADFGTKL